MKEAVRLLTDAALGAWRFAAE